MFTKQAQLLSSTLAKGQSGASQQSVMQLLANCAQPLATRGPLSVDTGAGRQAPPGGVITNTSYGDVYNVVDNSVYNNYYGPPGDWGGWPNVGGPAWDPLAPPAGGGGGGGAGDSYYFGGDTYNSTYSGDSNYWGGDTQYGDNYMTVSLIENNPMFDNSYYNNQYYNSQDSINNILNNYNSSETYNTFNDNSLINNNIANWYQQQFTDQSYNDFSTNLQTTNNAYNQTVNNFAGDNYFDNTTTTNTTTNNNVINQGDVTNLSNVFNQGDVHNTQNTYLNEDKTFIVNENGARITINQHLVNILVQILVGGNDGGPRLPPPPPVVRLLRGVGKVRLPKYTLDPETCEIAPGEQDVDIEVEIVPIRR